MNKKNNKKNILKKIIINNIKFFIHKLRQKICSIIINEYIKNFSIKNVKYFVKILFIFCILIYVIECYFQI